MPNKRLAFMPLLLPGIAALVGCGGYTSQYVPPPDGRPRLVWSDDKPVPMIAHPVPSECTEAVERLTGGSGLVTIGSHVGGGHVSGGYYHPVRVVGVVHVGGGPGYVPVPRPIGVPLPHFSGGGSSGGIGSIKLGSGGGGGSGDLGKGAILLVVVAILSLPFIALGLAVGRPEPEGEVANAIDAVNAQTDLARTEGPCDELVIAGEVAQ